MVSMDSFLQLLVIGGIIGIIIGFIVRVFIQALIFRVFIKKYDLPQDYWKAWMAVFIPSLVVSLIGLPIIFSELPEFLLVIIYLLFFPILIFSINIVYKTNTNISAKISFKYFLLILIIAVIGAGIMTIFGNLNDPLKENVPQPVCTSDCDFAYSLRNNYEGTLTVFGLRSMSNYGIDEEPTQDQIIRKEQFSSQQINQLISDIYDGNGDQRIIGKLNAKGCRYMFFSKSIMESGARIGDCEIVNKKNFFENLKRIIIS